MGKTMCDQATREKLGANPNINIATMDNAPTLPAALPPDRECEKVEGQR